MTVAEACAVLGLKPGRPYSQEQIEEAVRRTEQRTQSAFYHPAGGIQQQEDAIRTLQRVKQAGSVLLSRAQTGPVQVPRTASPRPAPSRRNPAAKLLVGFLSLPFRLIVLLANVLIDTACSPKKRNQVWQGIVQVAGVSWSIVRGLFLFSSWPLRLLLQRRCWSAVAALFLVVLVLAFCFVFVTGGLREIGTTVRRITFRVNYFLTTILGNTRGLVRMHGSFWNPFCPAMLGSIFTREIFPSEE